MVVGRRKRRRWWLRYGNDVGAGGAMGSIDRGLGICYAMISSEIH